MSGLTKVRRPHRQEGHRHRTAHLRALPHYSPQIFLGIAKCWFAKPADQHLQSRKLRLFERAVARRDLRGGWERIHLPSATLFRDRRLHSSLRRAAASRRNHSPDRQPRHRLPVGAEAVLVDALCYISRAGRKRVAAIRAEEKECEAQPQRRAECALKE